MTQIEKDYVEKLNIQLKLIEDINKVNDRIIDELKKTVKLQEEIIDMLKKQVIINSK
jgi:uncharacterized protein YdcH (DUF465 family)